MVKLLSLLLPNSLVLAYFIFRKVSITALLEEDFGAGDGDRTRDCPAWEFSIEISIFLFANKTLRFIFHSQDLLLMSSNFNYFRLIYFCLGHVLGTRFFVLLHAKILSF